MSENKTLFAFADLYNLEIKFVLLLFMNNLELQPKPITYDRLKTLCLNFIARSRGLTIINRIHLNATVVIVMWSASAKYGKARPRLVAIIGTWEII